ncbi:uncharacterized protein si:ch211-276i12.4 [Pangasianodon hypophthalmus]|uniref:uncharacterized protein si:ch211-276i12.4 n=1 Tax=Pangasianodon hypophthalmus TaxID=310915 RepID=UPI002308011F|nr:uncharacterized protein si:ch211-276i12.4 [Pangasianodon hypophthalmus]
MKRQMGKYFIPMHKSSKDELKLQKHQHLFPHQDVPHHHPNQHNSRRSSRNINDFHQYDSQNHPDHHQNFGGTEPHKEQLNTVSRALISSLSSSSSSSSASLLSESSLDSEWHFLLNRPQHSVSCSNLLEARTFQDEASGNVDFDLSVSALSVQHHQQKQQHFGHSGQQQQVSELGLRKSPLYRCQSKSVEGLMQSVSQECSPREHKRPHPLELSQLYKTTSLGQNFAVKDKAAATVNMARPKRAVSSIQLPSKGILKNKDEGQKHGNFRKAKSMEALSTKGQGTSPRKQSSVEVLRDNFVKEKLEFSAFLDEITRQVISPSRLSSFRINPSTTPASHKLPHEDRRKPAKASNQERVHVQKSSKQHIVQPVKSDSEKGRTDSNKHGHKCQTGSSLGAPHQHQHQRSQEKQHSTPESYRATSHKQHHGKYSQLLSEGTSTSSESILQEKHYQAKSKWGYNDGYGIHRKVNTEHKVSSLPAGLGMEFAKKSSTVTAPNLENINKHKYMGYRRHSKQSHRDSVSSMDRAELLEHYNKDLHENLLQMVSCIEHMEAELQCTKTELSSVKEKCKRLQESYTSCQQANSVLEQKLQSVVDSMNSEQKDHRISELTKQLDTEKNTVISQENINIPSLIRELLDKYFDSEDTVKNFLFSSSSRGQLDTDKSDRTLGPRDNQSSVRKRGDRVSDWLLPGQRDSADRQEHMAAFLPWTESQDRWVGLEKTDASALLLPKTGDSNLHSIAVDINSAMYRKIPDAKAKEHVPRVTLHHLGLETELHSSSMLAHRPGEVLSNQYHLEEIKGTGEQRTVGCAGIAQQEPDDITYRTAQKMLDNFISQIPSQSKERQLQRDLEDRDWTRGPTEGL